MENLQTWAAKLNISQFSAILILRKSILELSKGQKLSFCNFGGIEVQSFQSWPKLQFFGLLNEKKLFNIKYKWHKNRKFSTFCIPN